MNLLSKRTMILALALVPFFFSTVAHAQQSKIDPGRMNRDLSISEDILGKIFSDNYNQDMPFGRQAVDASYLPGYGIIFHVSGSLFPMFRPIGMNAPGNAVYRTNGGKMQGQTSGVFVGGRGRGFHWSGGAGNRLTRQQVIDRATEFLGNYGDTIGQLQPGDRITVIYDENGNNLMTPGFMVVLGNDSTQSKPVNMAISAKKSDITALTQNKITKKEFSSHLSVDDLEDGNQHKDLDIFAGILTRALRNTQRFEYSVRGDVNYTYLKDFGVIYFVNAEYSLQYLSTLAVFKNPAAAQRMQMLKDKGLILGTTSNQDDNQNREKAYNRFLDAMKDYITNYGRTLSTLHQNQKLIISANLNDGVGEQEKRMTFTVKANVLEELNNGRITTDQAKKEIQVQSF